MIRISDLPVPSAPNKNKLPRHLRGSLRSCERGFVLIAVLWFGLGLSAVASYLLISAQFQTRQAIAAAAEARVATEVLDAATHWTIASLENDGLATLTQTDQTRQFTRDFGGQLVTIKLISRETQVDLNLDDPTRIGLAFIGAGIAEDLAMELAARIVDFRDADDLRSVNGAERADYAAAGLDSPRNGAFLVPEDLQLVLGVTPEIYALVAPVLSVAARPVAETAPNRVTLTGNRLDPVGGSRAISRVKRPSLFVEIRTNDGNIRNFGYH